MTSIYEPHWSNYLQKYNLDASFFQNMPVETNKYCVIVEPRQMDITILVVKNFLFLLQKKQWGLIFFHGSENETFVKNALQGIPGIIFINLHVSNLTIQSYNDLLKGSLFWQQLLNWGCKHALIFQSDVVLFKDTIDDFLNYDYIGAPWILKYFNMLDVGNGGFSLRNVEKMLAIILKHGHEIIPLPLDDPLRPYEDIYFAYWAIQDGLCLPSVEQAKSFSVETLYHDDPCGMHKPLEWCFNHESITGLLTKSRPV